MDTRDLNSKEDVLKAKTDWKSLSKADRIGSLELKGYVVIPDLIEPSLIKKICNELDKLETKGHDYSENQRGYNDNSLIRGKTTASPSVKAKKYISR